MRVCIIKVLLLACPFKRFQYLSPQFINQFHFLLPPSLILKKIYYFSPKKYVYCAQLKKKYNKISSDLAFLKIYRLFGPFKSIFKQSIVPQSKLLQHGKKHKKYYPHQSPLNNCEIKIFTYQTTEKNREPRTSSCDKTSIHII